MWVDGGRAFPDESGGCGPTLGGLPPAGRALPPPRAGCRSGQLAKEAFTDIALELGHALYWLPDLFPTQTS